MMGFDSAKNPRGSFLAVIDPPWSADAGGGNRGANAHYELADVSRVAEHYYGARDKEGRRIWPPLNTRDPMLVWMWATQGAMTCRDDSAPVDDLPGFGAAVDMAPDAYRLARLLGVRVSTIFVWAKVDAQVCGGCGNGEHFSPEECGVCNGRAPSLFSPPARMGLGQRQRCEHEYLLCCVRNRVPVPPPEARPRSVIYAPRGAHSEKPEEAWRVIEQVSRVCMPGVVGIELNARVRRQGWAAVGRLDGEDKPVRYEEDLPCTTP